MFWVTYLLFWNRLRTSGLFESWFFVVTDKNIDEFYTYLNVLAATSSILTTVTVDDGGCTTCQVVFIARHRVGKTKYCNIVSLLTLINVVYSHCKRPNHLKTVSTVFKNWFTVVADSVQSLPIGTSEQLLQIIFELGCFLSSAWNSKRATSEKALNRRKQSRLSCNF